MYKRQGRARRLAADAEALARTITSSYAQAWALTEVVTATAQAGELDRAEALARTITDPGAQVWALTGVVTAAAQAGDLDRARRLAADAEALARTITGPSDQAWALMGVMTAAAQAGDLGRAGRLLAQALIIDPLEISWIETMCRFFPSALGSTWDILASAYATPD